MKQKLFIKLFVVPLILLGISCNVEKEEEQYAQVFEASYSVELDKNLFANKKETLEKIAKLENVEKPPESLKTDCENFEIKTTVYTYDGYFLEVSTPNKGIYEWYVHDDLVSSPNYKSEGKHNSSLYLDSVLANTDCEICAKRVDTNCNNYPICTTINIGCPDFKLAVYKSILDKTKKGSIVKTFYAIEEQTTSYGYTWTVDGNDVDYYSADGVMKYEFTENGTYNVCANLFSLKCDAKSVCKTIVIDNL